MADSLRPWILDYLVGIGESIGGNLAAAPVHDKGRKVQIIEFLTYESSEEDVYIWGKMSDKAFKMPVRFSKEAMAEYNRNVASHNKKRLTEYKTVIVTIKKFRPFFARMPLRREKGTSKMGMSEQSFLALDVGQVSYVGSADEGQCGDPRDLETNEDIRMWSAGLRQHGGDGNVLMNRKKEREQEQGTSAKSPQSNRGNGMHEQGHTTKPGLQVAMKRVMPANKAPKNPIPRHVPKTDEVNLSKEFDRAWRPINLSGDDRELYAVKNRSVEGSSGAQNVLSEQPVATSSRHVLDLASNTPPKNPCTPERSPNREDTNMQTTPPLEEWPPSQKGSEVDQDSVHAMSDKEGSDAESDGEPLDPLSPVDAEAMSSPTRSILDHNRRFVARKVPYPAPPIRSPSSTGHILAPNSDTSGFASQSQPRSQSQRPSKFMHSLQKPSSPQMPGSREMTADELTHTTNVGVSQPYSYDGDRSSPVQSAPVEKKARYRRGNGSGEVGSVDVREAEAAGIGEIRIAEDGPSNEDTRTNDNRSLPSLDDDDAQIEQELFGTTNDGVPAVDPRKGREFRQDSNARGELRGSSRLLILPTKPRSSRQSNNSPPIHNRPPSRISSTTETVPSSVADADALIQRAPYQSQSSVVEHDAEAWKEPTFMSKKSAKAKGKEKATSESRSNDNDSGHEKRSEPDKSVSMKKPDAVSRDPQRVEKNTTSSRSSRSRGSSPGSRVRIPVDPVARPSLDYRRRETKRAPVPTETVQALTAGDSRQDMADASRTNKRKADQIPESSVVEGGDAARGSKKRRTMAEVDRSDIGSGPKGDPEKRRADSVRRNGSGARSKDGIQQAGIKPGKKLGGFSVNFDHISTGEGGLPWINWGRLREVLLQTETARRKEGGEAG